MNYTLNTDNKTKTSIGKALKTLYSLVANENRNLVIAGVAMVASTAFNLAVPFLIGRAVDQYIVPGNFRGVLGTAAVLFGVFIAAFVAAYLQTEVMGRVAQRMLYKLRGSIFNKLQELPISFFNQNKTGDLISRINNDTNKINQFFSQSLIQLVSSIFLMIGVAVFVLSMNLELGIVALAPALLLLIITQIVSPWIKRKNARSLKETGKLSAEVQESIDNFKVTVAFNRRDYFRENFKTANENNFTTAVSAGLANGIFPPIYGLFAHIAQLAVLVYGIILIDAGTITIGVLIAFMAYLLRFYDPLRQIAAIWASFQVALAGWDRINAILVLSSDMQVLDSTETSSASTLMQFNDVSFTYPEGKKVLDNVSFTLEAGKIYALVGPTGGGKTTTASLLSRLFDPTEGTILLNGKDIRTYTPAERSQDIGFLLQEPFLFGGTVGENIFYGTTDTYDKEVAEKMIIEAGLKNLVEKFEQGLDTVVGGSGETMSLGQRQMIAFMRAVIRKPKLLILDEATANIDTVTEQLLEDILTKLPKETTLVIIAHRLNTIERADEIFFVNGGTITPAGSMEHAVEMIMGQKRTS